MIKRFLSLVLCLCLMSMATVALADTTTFDHDAITGNEASETIDITAVAVSTSEENAETIYSVEIVWGDMKFAWGYSSETTTATWDPETHTYSYESKTDNEDAKEGWYMLNETTALKHDGAEELGLTTQDAVLVFNHSNAKVDVAITTEDEKSEADVDALTATFNVSNDTVAEAGTEDNTWTLKEGTVGDIFANDGSSVAGTVSIDKEMTSPESYEEAVTIAKLTVTISAHTETDGE